MRPIPVHPRGPRRAVGSQPTRQVFACPRISPAWELDAFRALAKPRPEHALPILHATPQQRWSRRADREVEAVRTIVRERLRYEPQLHLGPAGDYHFLAEVADADIPVTRAMAVLLSHRLPGLWLIVGKLLVRDGRFFRRERRYKLNLVEATNVHLPRHVRAALRDVIKKKNRTRHR